MNLAVAPGDVLQLQVVVHDALLGGGAHDA